MQEEKTICYRPLNKSQFADLYNVNAKTFNRWLQPIKKDIGPINGQLFNPKQFFKIIEFLGSPEKQI